MSLIISVKDNWPYIGKAIGGTRFALKAALKYNHELESKVISAVHNLGLFSAINVSLHIKGLVSSFGQIHQCLLENDTEGAVLAGLSVVALVADGLDSFYTFGNSVRDKFGYFHFHEWLEKDILRLNQGLVILGTCMRVVKMFRTYQLLQKVRKAQDLKTVASEALGPNKNTTLRATSQKVVDVFERIQQGKPEGLTKASLEKYLERKITLGFCSITKNGVIFVAFRFFTVATIPGYIPLAMISTAVYFSLALHHFEQKNEQLIGSGVTY